MKEMLIRALRTFAQAAVGYISVNIAATIGGVNEMGLLKTTLIGLGVSAVAAGLAAVMNLPHGE